MSASLRRRVGVVAAGLTCLWTGYAAAQQVVERAREEIQQAQPAGQAEQPAAQQGQPFTAQFRGTTTAAWQSPEIARHLANCLLMKNQAEIEINEFAEQQAQNPKVKQFAQQMVQEHRQLAQKLQQLAGAVAAARSDASQPLDATGQVDAQRQAAETSRLAGQQGDSLNRLLEIDRKITERCIQNLREELQAKSGAEFDQCYIGSQIGGHMQMLAALEVISQEAQGPLRQIAEQARPTVQQHLDEAKQLAQQQWRTAQAGSSQAERPSSQTQRQ